MKRSQNVNTKGYKLVFNEKNFDFRLTQTLNNNRFKGEMIKRYKIEKLSLLFIRVARGRLKAEEIPI